MQSITRGVLGFLLLAFCYSAAYAQPVIGDDLYPTVRYSEAMPFLRGPIPTTNFSYVGVAKNSQPVGYTYKGVCYMGWTADSKSNTPNKTVYLGEDLNFACLGSVGLGDINNTEAGGMNIFAFKDLKTNGSPAIAGTDNNLYFIYYEQATDRIMYCVSTKLGTQYLSESKELGGNYRIDDFYQGFGACQYTSNSLYVTAFSSGLKLVTYELEETGSSLSVKSRAFLPQLDCGGVTNTPSVLQLGNRKVALAWTGGGYKVHTAIINDNNIVKDYLSNKTCTSPVLYKASLEDQDIHLYYRGFTSKLQGSNDNKVYHAIFTENDFLYNTVETITTPQNNLYAAFTPIVLPKSPNEDLGRSLVFPIDLSDSTYWYINSSFALCEARTYDLANWMGRFVKDEHTLADIVIPGSHNAGMNEEQGLDMSRFLITEGACNNCNAISQGYSVRNQLNMGFRYLDVKVIESILSDVYSFRRTGTPDPCYGQSFKDILEETKSFLSENPTEVVIMNVTPDEEDFILANYVLDDYEDIIYVNRASSPGNSDFLDATHIPIGQLRGKVIITSTDEAIQFCRGMKDPFEGSFDNNYRYYDRSGDAIALKAGQEKFISKVGNNASYKRIDWTPYSPLTDYTCDFSPAQTCFEKAKGFFHIILRNIICAYEVVSFVKDIEEGGGLITLYSILKGTTTIGNAIKANNSLPDVVNGWLGNKKISSDNKLNILFVDGSQYWLTDFCVDVNAKILSEEEFSLINSELKVHANITKPYCRLSTGAISIETTGGYPPYKHEWVGTGNTGTYINGRKAGFHKLKITDRRGHVTNRIFKLEESTDSLHDLPKTNTFMSHVLVDNLVNHFYKDCTSLLLSLNGGYTSSSVKGETGVWVRFEKGEEAARKRVSRNFEIWPLLEGGNATAEVTLYFSQEDFDDYNRYNVVKLPQNGTDTALYRNICVERIIGKSTDGSGSYESYKGAVQFIYPTAENIFWNASQKRWEISFPVRGMGGFFLHGFDRNAAHKWIDQSANLLTQTPIVSWKVEEQKASRYTVAYSEDGSHFKNIGKLDSKGPGTHTYSLQDDSFKMAPNRQIAYYRVSWLNEKGLPTYSPLIPLQISGAHLQLYPNPAATNFTLQSTGEGTILVYKVSGELQLQAPVKTGANTFDCSSWSSGLYYIKSAKSGEVIRLLVSRL